jgi:formylglycine-generating enzyme required for sulfatase activity
LKTFIDTTQTIEKYEENQPWLEDLFTNLTKVEWENAREEVSEILYKWGQFLLDHGKYTDGLARFWELYEKFPETRWYSQVFEELVALEQPEGMVLIPGGTLTLGEGSGQEIAFKPYFLDIYPVTNAQYLQFMKETSYPAPSYWIGDMYPIGKANHPVVWVCAEDAISYACWRGKRLPTEVEWENASKGPQCAIWPWGNEYEPMRCNCRESGVGDTTPVGYYETGCSYYNCYDMSGNVWEWTDSWYDSHQTYKVLKGGSWFSFPQYTTTTYRNFDFSDSRKGIYGFRCCKTFGRTNKPS